MIFICKNKSRRQIIGIKTNLGFSEKNFAVCYYYYYYYIRETQVIDNKTGRETETQYEALKRNY